MKTKKGIMKRNYIAPEVTAIILDNEISLSLDSLPPWGPGEVQNNLTPDYLNNDPFKTDIV
ncbi:MAG: hypothetical protein PHS59_10490 [Paludibacter sp.]|nr:hypothetical protein [Paludibacter sp.]